MSLVMLFYINAIDRHYFFYSTNVILIAIKIELSYQQEIKLFKKKYIFQINSSH